MNWAEDFLDFAVILSLTILAIAFLITTVRIIRGPTLPDRILGLDTLVAVAIGFIAVVGVKTGFNLYIDIALALGLVGFLATVAFARFVLEHGMTAEDRTETRLAEEQSREPTL